MDKRFHRVFKICLVFLTTLAVISYVALNGCCHAPQWPYHKFCESKVFRRVLLVIIFNHPVYSNVPILKSFYRQEFTAIMLCGPETSSSYGVEKVAIFRGYFGYDCLATAVRKNPNFEGYLFVNDDMIVNFWNLRKLDRTKIWEGPRIPITVGNYSGALGNWYWWRSPLGVARCNETFREIFQLLETSERLRNAVKILENNTMSEEENFIRSGGKYFCIRSRSDIFYLPGKFSKMFTELSDIFRKHGVFHEVALPTISRMLDFQERFEHIPGVYLPGRVGSSPVEDSKYLWTHYNTTIGFIHPIKFNGSDETLNKALFNNWIVPYGKNTAQLCTT